MGNRNKKERKKENDNFKRKIDAERGKLKRKSYIMSIYWHIVRGRKISFLEADGGGGIWFSDR